jgi:methionine-rich copper-binding protein CopC
MRRLEGMKRRRRWATLATLTVATAAVAHVHLRQSDPAEGAVVKVAPAQIVLRFTEPALLTALWIQQDANPRQKLEPVPTEAEATITVPTPGLKAGKYVVTWRAVSPDRHVMSGELHFTVS